MINFGLLGLLMVLAFVFVCFIFLFSELFSFIGVDLLLKVMLFSYVLLKSSETDNELTKEVGGYEHVVVLQKIKVVDGDLVETLQQLPRGTVAGDCIHEFFFFYNTCSGSLCSG